MESFGKYLKEQRESRGIGIEEIARVTKIGSGQLRSLENDDFGALPPIAFVKGFVRAYSHHIKIDANEAILRLEQYLSEIEQEEEDSFGEIRIRQFRRASPEPRVLIAAIVAFLSVIILAAILAIKSCSTSTGALEPLPQTQHQQSVYAKTSISDLPSVLSVEERANPYLPTVPPQAYRVIRIGRPESSPADTDAEAAQTAAEETHAGGSTTSTD